MPIKGKAYWPFRWFYRPTPDPPIMTQSPPAQPISFRPRTTKVLVLFVLVCLLAACSLEFDYKYNRGSEREGSLGGAK